MTKDELLRQAELREQTAAAMRLVAEHGEEKCNVEFEDARGQWHIVLGSVWCLNTNYRATLKPQPKLVPWESIDDVPLTHVFRTKGTVNLMYPIEAAGSSWLVIAEETEEYKSLFFAWEHAELRDKYSEMVWLPCGKEVIE